MLLLLRGRYYCDRQKQCSDRGYLGACTGRRRRGCSEYDLARLHAGGSFLYATSEGFRVKCGSTSKSFDAGFIWLFYLMACRQSDSREHAFEFRTRCVCGSNLAFFSFYQLQIRVDMYRERVTAGKVYNCQRFLLCMFV